MREMFRLGEFDVAARDALVNTILNEEQSWEFWWHPRCCRPYPSQCPSHRKSLLASLATTMSNQDYYGGGQPPYSQGQGQYYPPQG